MNTLPQDKEVLFEVLKRYVNSQITYLKLESVEKLSQLFASLLLVLICIILGLCCMFYLSAAFIVWSSTVFSGYLPGIFIVSGVFILIMMLLYVFRTSVFLNPFIRLLSTIMFDPPANGEKGGVTYEQ